MLMEAQATIKWLQLLSWIFKNLKKPSNTMRKHQNLSKNLNNFNYCFSPDDTVLVREVGKALVMTHDYKRAIKYYETTLMEDPKLVINFIYFIYLVGFKDRFS